MSRQFHMSIIQPVSPHNRSIINATPEEQLDIIRFLNHENLIHQHLDWFSPVDWLGQRPYLVEKERHQIQAVLLAAPEVEDVTWIRLFCVNKSLVVQDVWTRLLDSTMIMLSDMRINQIAALSLNDGFTDLLVYANFHHANNILVLEWKRNSLLDEHRTSNVEIRPMREEDLPEVNNIDHLAFRPLWQNSLESLTKAFRQPGISTIAIKHGEIVGYQISTSLTIHGHLARLAVRPTCQGQQIASALVNDLLNQFTKTGVWRVTVNTQADNIPSLAVYKKFGFQTTGEILPVYQYAL